MSNVSIIKTEKEKLGKHDISGLFEIFVKDRFKNWDNYMKDSEFAKLANNYRSFYGNSAFQGMADHVVEVEGIRIKDLLSEFGSYIKKYY